MSNPETLVCLCIHGGISHLPSKILLRKIAFISEITKINVKNRLVKKWLAQNEKGLKVDRIPCFIIKKGDKSEILSSDKVGSIIKWIHHLS